MRLRASVKIRNDHMVAAREAMGLSQGGLASLAGVAMRHVQSFEALRYDTYRVSTLKAAASRIAVTLGLSEEDVFPSEMEGKRLESDRTAWTKVEARCLVDAVNTFEARMIAQDPSEVDEEPRLPDLAELIEACMAEHERREDQAKSRYERRGQSPDGGGFLRELEARGRGLRRAFEALAMQAHGLTLDEIGRAMKVSRERARQLADKGALDLKRYVARSGNRLLGGA